MSFLTDLIDRAKGLLADDPPKPTQTRAVKTTSFDRADFHQAMDEVPELRRERDTLADTVDYVDDFMGDLHSTFFKIRPELHGREEMHTGHIANRDVIEQMLAMPEVSNLRQHSVTDTYGSAMAMVAMEEVTQETMTRVREAQAEALQRQAEAEAAAQAQKDALSVLLEALANETDPNAQAGLGESLQSQMDQFAQAQAEAQAAAQQAAQQGEQAMQQQANAIRSAAKAADEDLTNEGELSASFGVDPGVLQRMPVAERIELAKKLKSNRLAQFAKLLGQFKAVQQSESRKRVVNAASEVHGVTQSDHLERMVAGEYLNFADESLQTLMLLRFTEHQLNTYDVRGKEKLGQGPIVCVVDESGSMSMADVAGGTREAWSKALALALCDQARRRKRDFVYIGFGSAGQQHVVKFPKGEAAIDSVIEMTEHFFHGGTHYEKPMQMALDIIEHDFESGGKERPDIVFISDDEYGDLDEDFLERFRRVRDKTSIRAYGIALGCSVGGAMNQLCDNVRSVTELVSDPRSVGDLFRTI